MWPGGTAGAATAPAGGGAGRRRAGPRPGLPGPAAAQTPAGGARIPAAASPSAGDGRAAAEGGGGDFRPAL